jgi:hypothetical protein
MVPFPNGTHQAMHAKGYNAEWEKWLLSTDRTYGEVIKKAHVMANKHEFSELLSGYF